MKVLVGMEVGSQLSLPPRLLLPSSSTHHTLDPLPRMFRPILRIPSSSSCPLSVLLSHSSPSLVLPSARLGSFLRPPLPSSPQGVPIARRRPFLSLLSFRFSSGARFSHDAAESYDQFNDRWKLFFDQAPDLFEVQVSPGKRGTKEGGREGGVREREMEKKGGWQELADSEILSGSRIESLSYR